MTTATMRRSDGSIWAQASRAAVLQQRPYTVDRLLVELDRRQDEVAGGERSNEADVRVRVGVDQAHVELVVDRLEEVAQVACEWRVQRSLALKGEQRIAGGDEDEAFRGHRTLSVLRSRSEVACATRARLDSARGLVKLPWWSRSIASTRHGQFEPHSRPTALRDGQRSDIPSIRCEVNALRCSSSGA